MVRSGLSPGFTSRFANTNFRNALERGGQSNTDRSRLGSTPVRNDIQGADNNKLNPGRTDNPSQSANLQPEFLAATGVMNPSAKGQFSATEDGAGHGVAHYNDQFLGRSLRSPMSSQDNPTKDDESKNIFFRFHGEENKEVPGIWMYINPHQLSFNMRKKIPSQTTRGGHVLFHWGDELDEISANAITGSFARPDCKEADASTQNGIDRYTGTEPDFGLDRRDTWPYWRFMQLLALYRNNGITITTVDESTLETGGFGNGSSALASAFSRASSSNPRPMKEGTLSEVTNSVSSGSVNGARTERPTFSGIEMHYDDQVFTGFFSSLNVSERAEEPFKFNIDFRFTVLNTEYNKVFTHVAGLPNARPQPGADSKGNPLKRDMLANFQIPRFNSL